MSKDPRVLDDDPLCKQHASHTKPFLFLSFFFHPIRLTLTFLFYFVDQMFSFLRFSNPCVIQTLFLNHLIHQIAFGSTFWSICNSEKGKIRFCF